MNLNLYNYIIVYSSLQTLFIIQVKTTEFQFFNLILICNYIFS